MRPDDLAKNKTTHPLRKVAPILMIFDLIVALVVWLLRGTLFENTETASFLAAAFAIAGVSTYFILIRITKQAETQNKKDKY